MQDSKDHYNFLYFKIVLKCWYRTRGWISTSNTHSCDVEVAYKKVGDGHPLRLWRVATEVEAPPQEVLYRVLRERHIWDLSLLKVQLIQQLEPHTEVYQYACSSMEPLAPRDYCVLRLDKYSHFLIHIS